LIPFQENFFLFRNEPALQSFIAALTPWQLEAAGQALQNPYVETEETVRYAQRQRERASG